MAARNPERMNGEALAHLIAPGIADEPVVMLNLLRFVPDGGRGRYAEYETAVVPLLRKVGARVVYSGDPGAPLLGEGFWDQVLLVEYPSRRAFLEMVRSDAYRRIEYLRSEALLEGELHPMSGPSGS